MSVGFGSMGSADPERVADIVIAAAAKVGARLVILGGWRGMTARQTEDVFFAAAVPHEWLFPRVQAIVHHGGAGTTAAALLSGVPAVVVPFAVDQPFWAARAHALGVAPPPIPRKRLNTDVLASAIEAALQDHSMRKRAMELGRLLRAENGVSEAAACFGKRKSDCKNFN